MIFEIFFWQHMNCNVKFIRINQVFIMKKTNGHIINIDSNQMSKELTKKNNTSIMMINGSEANI